MKEWKYMVFTLAWTIVCILVLGFTQGWHAPVFRSDSDASRDWVRAAEAEDATLPPCVWEDGSDSPIPCIWVGSEWGNRTGDSVVIIKAP